VGAHTVRPPPHSSRRFCPTCCHKQPYACDHDGCGKIFAHVGPFEVHKRSHTGEKPFACDYVGCSARCISSSALEVHKRSHTGEKPFACDYVSCSACCSACCSTSSTLKVHKLSHTGEKPFACDPCLRLRGLQCALHHVERPQGAQALAHGREAVCLRLRGLQRALLHVDRPQGAQALAHGREAVRLRLRGLQCALQLVEHPQGAQALAHGLDVMHVGIREQHSKVTARAGHPAWLGQPTWTAVRKKQAPLVKHGLRLDRVVHRGMVVVCFTTANDNSKQFAQDEVLGFLVVVQSYAQFSTAFTV
jgi:hypothetical protein